MTVNCILERVPETQSTNDDLLARWRAGELIDPVARMARNQTSGKGRAGRTWVARPGDSLCFSVAFPFSRTPAQLSGLSLLVGLAVIKGLADACKLTETDLFQAGLRLKWPNDVLLNHAKLAGVLIEGGQTKVGDPTWMVVGIGINLHNAFDIEKNLGQISQKVSSLEQLFASEKDVPDNEYIWLKLVESCIAHFKKFDQLGFSAYADQWLQWDAFINRNVSITGTGKEPVYGTAKGVDSNGALLLEQEGNTITVYAGDVSLRAQ